MSSFLSGKRSRLIAAAVAGTLTVAAVATAVVAALPSGSAAASAATVDARLTIVTQQHAAAHGAATTSAQRLVALDKVRSGLGERQLQHEVAAAKAAARATTARATTARATAARAAAARATAARAAAARTAASAPTGTPEQIARQMLAKHGWSSSQFSCLYPLWYHESGWNAFAQNPGSGAYGIPQSLPGSQMASAGADWATNPATQIKWGLTYIQGRYRSPCGAWAHEQAYNWY